MKSDRALTLCLAGASLVVLCAAFVFLPDRWNLIPLLLIALVLSGLSFRKQAIQKPPDANQADRTPAANEEEDGLLEAATEPPEADDKKLARRINRAFGPIVAGLIIDLMDFTTFGPIGLAFGFLIGGFAGYWMGRALGLEKRAALFCSLAAGIYCTIPGTEIIPLATIIGACVRFWQTDRRRE